jgi:hypothetical protein
MALPGVADSKTAGRPFQAAFNDVAVPAEPGRRLDFERADVLSILTRDQSSCPATLNTSSVA